MILLRSGKPIATIFDLLGRKEDDMTYALGFVASRSSRFAAGLVADVGGPPGELGAGSIRLQEVDGDGRTDVELEWPGQFHAVLEAKRGPWLPTVEQLKKYVARLEINAAPIQRLVTVTNAPTEYADATRPSELDGIPVVHLTWRRIRQIARVAKSGETHRNRPLLDEFDAYLEEILGMENVRSNMVYVLSLGAGGAWGLDFKDVVNNRGYYFDPVSRYRSGLPNYIAFRYDGRLQTIHHVEGASVFDDPHAAFDDAKSSKEEPHYLFRLGPAIKPQREVKNGPNIQRSNRVWCMLDLLLTSTTISDAWSETRKRLSATQGDGEDEPQA